MDIGNRKPNKIGSRTTRNSAPENAEVEGASLTLGHSVPDDSWRTGGTDPLDWAQSGLSRHEAGLMAMIPKTQLVFACDAIDCKAKFASGNALAVHQGTIHAHWPVGTSRMIEQVAEYPPALRSAFIKVEQQFAAILQQLIPHLDQRAVNLTSLTQDINELHDVYSATGLPTAAKLCSGAVKYATFIAAEWHGDDIEGLRDQLQLAIVNLQHAQGLGGELEAAFRSLRFRSALMDHAELREMADGEPRDTFCAAAGAILGSSAPDIRFPDPPRSAGEPMRLMITLALHAREGQAKLAALTDGIPETWARLPWMAQIMNMAKELRG